MPRLPGGRLKIGVGFFCWWPKAQCPKTQAYLILIRVYPTKSDHRNKKRFRTPDSGPQTPDSRKNKSEPKIPLGGALLMELGASWRTALPSTPCKSSLTIAHEQLASKKSLELVKLRQPPSIPGDHPLAEVRRPETVWTTRRQMRPSGRPPDSVLPFIRSFGHPVQKKHEPAH